MKLFSDFLENIDKEKLEYDILDLNFSKEEYQKLLSEFTPEQFKYIFKLSKAISLAYLRQYDLFLREQSDE